MWDLVVERKGVGDRQLATGTWALATWRRSRCGRVTKQKRIATLDRPEAHRFKPSEGREQGQGPGNVRFSRCKLNPPIGQ